jgi:hypothetical protein
MQRSAAHHCIYVWKLQEKILYLILYVDDLLMASGDKGMMERLKTALMGRFKMTDMGELKHFMAIQMVRNRSNRTIWLSQHRYIAQTIKNFGLEDCKPISTPQDISVKLTKAMEPQNDEEIKEMSTIPYRNAVGSLIYAMLGTRPDIAVAVGAVSQYLENPGIQHWKAVKRILRYLKGTLDFGLMLGGQQKRINLLGYSDADWGGDLDFRKSTTGIVFLLGVGAVCWQSKKQSSVALSSTEAEYMALSLAAKEVYWLRALLEDLKLDQHTPTTILEDNQGAIALSRNPTAHSRTKHINIRYHFIREAVEDGKVDLVYCRTEEMVADILTKALPAVKFTYLRSKMGVMTQTSD